MTHAVKCFDKRAIMRAGATTHASFTFIARSSRGEADRSRHNSPGACCVGVVLRRLINLAPIYTYVDKPLLTTCCGIIAYHRDDKNRRDEQAWRSPNTSCRRAKLAPQGDIPAFIELLDHPRRAPTPNSLGRIKLSTSCHRRISGLHVVDDVFFKDDMTDALAPWQVLRWRHNCATSFWRCYWHRSALSSTLMTAALTDFRLSLRSTVSRIIDKTISFIRLDFQRKNGLFDF